MNPRRGTPNWLRRAPAPSRHAPRTPRIRSPGSPRPAVVVDPYLARCRPGSLPAAWRACASFVPRAGPLVNWLLVITGHTAIYHGQGAGSGDPPGVRPADANDPPAAHDIDRPDPGSGCETPGQHRAPPPGRGDRDGAACRPYADVAAESCVRARQPCGQVTRLRRCASPWKPPTRRLKSGHKASPPAYASGLKGSNVPNGLGSRSARHVSRRPGDSVTPLPARRGSAPPPPPRPPPRRGKPSCWTAGTRSGPGISKCWCWAGSPPVARRGCWTPDTTGSRDAICCGRRACSRI